MGKIAKAASSIQPFHVMRLLEKARQLEQTGRTLVHMEIGEPDFPLAEPVAAALHHAVEAGDLSYTPACGLPELRQAIAESYGAPVSADNIVITPGSSGAIQLALACIIDPGDEVLLPDPGYPCNRHIVSVLGGRPVALNVNADTAFQPTAQQIRQQWSDHTAAVMLASPANPTGAVLDQGQLTEIIAVVGELGGNLVMDEIYIGLTRNGQLQSAAGRGEHVLVVNSFSKYHGLTGLRTGWLVAPRKTMPVAEKLAQNLFLSASTLGQAGALSALSDEAIAIFEQRRREIARRMDYLMEALPGLGFVLPVKPRGAFYVYADCSGLTRDSFSFCDEVLEQAGVVITPGRDFGDNQPERHVRFSCTSDIQQLKAGVQRLQAYLSSCP